MLARLALARTSPLTASTPLSSRRFFAHAAGFNADGAAGKMAFDKCRPRFMAYRPMFFGLSVPSGLFWNGLAGYGLYSLLTRNDPELARQEAERQRSHERAMQELRLKYKFGGTVLAPDPTQTSAAALLTMPDGPHRAVESTE